VPVALTETIVKPEAAGFHRPGGPGKRIRYDKPAAAAPDDQRKVCGKTHAPDAIAAIKQGFAELQQEMVRDRARGVGDMAPAFSLPDTRGEVVASDDLLAAGPPTSISITPSVPNRPQPSM